jgi:3-hydroxyisobutyrate dehydrogenase-like beta-hydroxyacid dehydrogenase
LCIFAGGRPDSVSRCQPLFDVIGRQTVVVSKDPADANLLQLCAVGLIGCLVESLGEAMALADKGGIGQERLLKLMSESLFAAGMHSSYGALIGGGVGRPAVMTVEQARANTALLLDTAQAVGARMPMMNLLRDRLDTLAGRGLGDRDWLEISASGTCGLPDGTRGSSVPGPDGRG